MDIKRAKQEIKDSIEAYLAKDEFGDYRIPGESARDRSFWWDLRESEKHRLWNRLRKNAVSGW